MQYLAAFLFTVLIYSLVCPFVVQAKLFSNCTFEEVLSRTSGQNMSALPLTFSGQLPSTRNVSHSCVVKTDNRNSLLYLRAKRNKESKAGALHVSVYGKDESFLGHLDISQSTVGWSSLLLGCPSPSATDVRETYLTFSGTSGLVFTVELIEQDEEVKLDGPTKPFTLSSENPVRVFQFIPTEDISQTQLDVTVHSTSDVPAYLKVSRDCKDIKDNIELVDYKGESIRLSFAKKGRITLSKFSIPPLTDSTSSWFIGIAIKNATGDTPFDATKVVTLELAKSFDYSYDGPLLILSLPITVVCAFLIASWALYCFNHIKPSKLHSPAHVNAQEEAQPIRVVQNTNLIRISWKELFPAMWEVMCNNFKGRTTGTYSYITGIVGSVFFVGAFQFVFADWYLMIQEGDRDHCYYNDFCYRVRYRDIPYNLMISNLPYVLHGIILALTVWYMEGELFARCKKLAKPPPAPPNNYDRLPNHLLKCPNIVPHLAKMNVPELVINKQDEKAKQKAKQLYAEAHKKKFTFSIGYAFAVALIFEGLFSSLYHLCPSKLTFQFDTAFMFVIAGLIVLILYNGIEMSECPARGEAKRLVGAGNFFLYFVVPLYIFNYFGSMYEAGLFKILQIPFFIVLAVWCILMAGWAGYKVFPKECSKPCISMANLAKLFAFLLGVGVPTFCIVFWRNNLPQAFLFTCISECILVIMCKVAKKVCGKRCKDCCDSKERNCILFTMQVLYVLATLAVGIFAVRFFVFMPTTDKVESAENSRNLNQECVLLGFFDHHDIWHILSSFTLLMGAHLVMFISYDPPVNENDTEHMDENETEQMESGRMQLR
ncbi:hypothetical protein OS493_005469 [Desmophyllum pertusum]|uniref:Uncharacterized protein n=1 Tax=Desmophyllum pertusum TaxID=174260 RepID=A0A9W9YSA4_9CNID|nr:hypothetical protein OS493_005469 [Desmophyllum pertusum]